MCVCNCSTSFQIAIKCMVHVGAASKLWGTAPSGVGGGGGVRGHTVQGQLGTIFVKCTKFLFLADSLVNPSDSPLSSTPSRHAHGVFGLVTMACGSASTHAEQDRGMPDGLPTQRRTDATSAAIQTQGTPLERTTPDAVPPTSLLRRADPPRMPQSHTSSSHTALDHTPPGAVHPREASRAHLRRCRRGRNAPCSDSGCKHVGSPSRRKASRSSFCTAGSLPPCGE